MTRAWAVSVWDALRDAGEAFGLEPFGYRALDALRMEKGYRYYGTDMTMLETPDEAGLGGMVRLGKGPFLGREALEVRRAVASVGPSRRLTTLLIGRDAAYLPVFGGEAVREDGVVVGRLRSVAFGPTVERTIGYVYRSAEVKEGADPDGGRVRRTHPGVPRPGRPRGIPVATGCAAEATQACGSRAEDAPRRARPCSSPRMSTAPSGPGASSSTPPPSITPTCWSWAATSWASS